MIMDGEWYRLGMMRCGLFQDTVPKFVWRYGGRPQLAC